MYFLVQINIKKDGTVSKGTSDYTSMHDAMVQFHVAMASAMQKEDVAKFAVVILNENGLTQKVEVYEAPIEAEPVEEVAEEPTEEVE